MRSFVSGGYNVLAMCLSEPCALHSCNCGHRVIGGGEPLLFQQIPGTQSKIRPLPDRMTFEEAIRKMRESDEPVAED